MGGEESLRSAKQAGSAKFILRQPCGLDQGQAKEEWVYEHSGRSIQSTPPLDLEVGQPSLVGSVQCSDLLRPDDVWIAILGQFNF